MKIRLDRTSIIRGNWHLAAQGTFSEGVHLVSGPVGSGKSTLALILAGLLQPATGTVTREGITDPMLSLQFPEYHITGPTIRDECLSWGTDPEEILRKTGLEGRGNLPPLHLSRGELERLHLACILARPHDLLILDEPFCALDCREKVRISCELGRRAAGIMIIFTHEQEIFPRVDHLWEIQNGELQYRGPVPEALSRWCGAPPLIRQLVQAGRTPSNLTIRDLEEAACRT